MVSSSKFGWITLFFCFLLSFFALYLFSPPTALPENSEPNLFSAERAMKHLKVIASEPHSIGTLQNDKVIRYIVEELEKLGLNVEIQDTLVKRVGRDNSIRLARVKNIIGHLKGSDNSKAVMLMAHHDSQPNTPGAADDGSGVVSILESIRAIKASGDIKNDLVALISDAEEIGLMGAKAFVDYHPLLKEVGILINLEARGNQGVSMSFEMNTDNGWIVREFAKAAPHPFANSLAYEVYRVMPNDTDFSEFRDTDIAGVNSACVEGFVAYHSMTDTPENMSLDLLQHHGSNMLGMLRHFGNLTIDNTRAADAIFFNPLGDWLIIYPASYDIFFIIFTVVLFVLVLYFGTKKDEISIATIFIGIGYFLVSLTIAGIGSILLLQLILYLYPHYTAFYANNFYNVGFYFIGFVGWAGLVYSMLYGFLNNRNSLSLSLGGILMLIMSMFGLMISLPTGTYLLYLPLSFYLLVQLFLLILNITPENSPLQYNIGQFIALIVPITFWTPTIYLLFATFGLTVVLAGPVLMVSFLFMLMIPIIQTISANGKYALVGLSLGVLFLSFLMGHLNSDWTEEKPLQAYLAYAQDEDSNQAMWVSFKDFKPTWINHYIRSSQKEKLNEIYPNLDWKAWKTKTASAKIPETTLQLTTDSLLSENKRLLVFDISFPNLKNSVEVFIEDGEAVEKAMVNDFDLDIKARERDNVMYFNFFAPPIEGFTLSIITNNNKQKMRVVDRTIGLPTEIMSHPLPKELIHGPSYRNNISLVKKSYEW